MTISSILQTSSVSLLISALVSMSFSNTRENSYVLLVIHLVGRFSYHRTPVSVQEATVESFVVMDYGSGYHDWYLFRIFNLLYHRLGKLHAFS